MVAKIFRSGNSQAVRIPRQLRLRGTEVDIFRRGDELVLRERQKGLAAAFELLATMPDDWFKEDLADTPPQKRRGL